MSKSKKLLLLAVLSLPTGCAEYLNHHDTVSLAAGDSNRINRILQAEDPFNERSFDTDIASDGKRAAGVVRKYSVPAAQKDGGATTFPATPIATAAPTK